MISRNCYFTNVVSGIAVVAVLLLGGCNKNPLGRTAVSGRVTFDGKPLDKGTIEFRPQTGNAIVGTGAVVLDGNYSIATLKGLPPGKYEVRIYSSRPDTSPLPKGASPEGVRPGIERIPPKYNVQTTLAAEVTDKGSNKFDFDLSAGP